MKSLDPRVNRLPVVGTAGNIIPKAALDQFGTFEVFVQPKEGKPFQHEGAVHAPDLEMAYVLAKETFTRRFTCTSLYVTDTRDVHISPTTEGSQNVYTLIEEPVTQNNTKSSFEIYHLLKRGKQHQHIGTVEASTPEEAMFIAKQQFNNDKMVYNVWAIRTSTIRFTTPEEKDLWNTLPEKKFRDASDYKGGDKLKLFLERQS
ncbi:phenylacetic acid degradation b [Ohtaekwangia koreensis]|uniref:Ring-1,2-phenylacetyl-CoA epoxidase subunit PaaB n=1 Tax=Ohtaekwangia koreensis TaxID=688867 RepID=A0A1T5MKX5_9BACT|nr:phenylacetic acid degradation b [Ohtaekwangia koreensis]SKC88644.1 ring-1,2-phenylacetyl-CoA epoxidase subunit PaaB [Ohtaekwangia koreensis]